MGEFIILYYKWARCCKCKGDELYFGWVKSDTHVGDCDYILVGVGVLVKWVKRWKSLKLPYMVPLLRD